MRFSSKHREGRSEEQTAETLGDLTMLHSNQSSKTSMTDDLAIGAVIDYSTVERLLEHARKLESDRARLIEALGDITRLIQTYRPFFKADDPNMAHYLETACALLSELEGK